MSQQLYPRMQPSYQQYPYGTQSQFGSTQQHPQGQQYPQGQQHLQEQQHQAGFQGATGMETQWSGGQGMSMRGAGGEIRQTVMNLHRFEVALELAEMQAIENRKPRLARLCGDLAVIANAEKRLVVRQSPFAEPIGQAVKRTIQQGVQELQQFASDPDVQEAISEGQQSVSAVDRALSQLRLGSMASQAGFQPMYGPTGGFGGGGFAGGAGGMTHMQGLEHMHGLGQRIRQTVMPLHQLETTLQLARVNALDRGMPRLARICGDLAIVTELEKRLVLRQSPFVQPIGRAVEETIQQGVQHLQQFSDDPDVQEAISEARQVITTTQQQIQEMQSGFQRGAWQGTQQQITQY